MMTQEGDLYIKMSCRLSEVRLLSLDFITVKYSLH